MGKSSSSSKGKLSSSMGTQGKGEGKGEVAGSGRDGMAAVGSGWLGTLPRGMAVWALRGWEARLLGGGCGQV